jgi:membrane associated rhomboid family serine protease
MWLVFMIENFLNLNFGFLGIYPRSWFGLLGVFTAPFIHGNYFHLISNSLPLLVLGTALFFFYDRVAYPVFMYCYLFTNALVWLLARPSIHIGASGLIYGLASFLIFFGIFRKDFKSLAISLVVTFFYGSLVYGIWPNQPGVSWESHLFGGITGALTASSFSKVRRVSS